MMAASTMAAWLLASCDTGPAPDPEKAELLALCVRAEDTSAIDVATTEELTSALIQARPGERIYLAPGSYQGPFDITTSGSQEALIGLCGTEDAELVGEGSEGYGLHLDGADWWTVQGVRVTGGQKGVVLDDTQHTSLVDLQVTDTGQEGVHLRTHSSDNVVIGVHVESTGQNDPKFGEGIYIGSAQSNWCRYTECQPDRSDRNRIIGNSFGPDVTAENIDIKEGTTAGVVAGNAFSGSGATTADSWVDVKGNDWEIRDNTGTEAPEDGMAIHVILDGWGNDTAFTSNEMNVNASGFGIRVDKDARGTIVNCDNTAEGAAKGLSNIECTE
jgi:hypothetical protein